MLIHRLHYPLFEFFDYEVDWQREEVIDAQEKKKKKANTCCKEEKVNCWNFFHAALLLKAEQDISFQKWWESLKIIVLSHTQKITKPLFYDWHFSWCWLKSVIWNPLLFSSFLMCPQWCSGHDTPFKLANNSRRGMRDLGIYCPDAEAAAERVTVWT